MKEVKILTIDERGRIVIPQIVRKSLGITTNSQLMMISDSEIKEVKGDPMPVGIGERAGTSFTKHELDLQKGDSLYMYSDGYPDQFGGPNQKRLGNTRFKEWLTDVQDKIMFDQKRILDAKFIKWKGTTDQMDDVLVMGIKL